MNIVKENVEGLNEVLKVTVEQSDYQDRVAKGLNDYRKKAKIDGFRPGMVPVGIINKLYRKPIMVEEINKMVSEAISKYIYEEKLRLLGEPMPSETHQKNVDWDNDTTFEFAFDLGLAPTIDLKISEKDKLPYFEIKVDQELRDSYITSYRRRYGKMLPGEIAGEEDVIRGKVEQLGTDGNPMENGIALDDTFVSLKIITDAEQKSKFVGSKAGDIIDFDIRKTFTNDTDLAAMLKINKDEVESLTPAFRFIPNEVRSFQDSEINQEFFDKVYGEGIVNSEEEFKQRVEADIRSNLSRESDFKFMIDVKEKLMEKTKVELPNNFLKRWLFAINEGKFTMEQIEKDFEHFANDLKWQLIRDTFAVEKEIKITEEDVLEKAKEFAMDQFKNYGFLNVPDSEVENFAHRILSNKEEDKRIREKLVEDKVIEAIKGIVKLDTKEISTKEFDKLLNSK
ncbi:trigger factor [Williamwhitmania taraxaci]|uniref:Trigger factor n=1 Tax=Williamwhitmania taraxaci TaxID=1640674 RepID=A0A1G6PL68_9BACT|nr:trigger factor [Williamwhitmania taraxaci]SDC80105.1 trigger factor [Williamwhitmania taraxaci]